MKQYIMGIITGIVITASVTAFAAQMEVKENPFKILVNGMEKNIAGYNINDNTYFKLRDVADATGNLEVGFENDTILLNTTKEALQKTPVTPTPTKTPSVGKYIPPKELTEPNDYNEIFAVQDESGKYYVTLRFIWKQVDDHGFDFKYDADTQKIIISKNNKEIINKETEEYDITYRGILYDEYIDEILPILAGK